MVFFFFQAEDGIRDDLVTGVQTCALPILGSLKDVRLGRGPHPVRHEPVPRQRHRLQRRDVRLRRSEEHTSELQSPDHLVCRLLLEKKKKSYYYSIFSYLDGHCQRPRSVMT